MEPSGEANKNVMSRVGLAQSQEPKKKKKKKKMKRVNERQGTVHRVEKRHLAVEKTDVQCLPEVSK